MKFIYSAVAVGALVSNVSAFAPTGSFIARSASKAGSSSSLDMLKGDKSLAESSSFFPFETEESNQQTGSSSALYAKPKDPIRNLLMDLQEHVSFWD